MRNFSELKLIVFISFFSLDALHLGSTSEELSLNIFNPTGQGFKDSFSKIFLSSSTSAKIHC